jgi:purine-nucleoside phosphorylase
MPMAISFGINDRCIIICPVDEVSAGLDRLEQFRGQFSPEYAVILGSGIKFPAKNSRARVEELPYDSLPGIPKPSVKGHSGILKMARLKGKAGLIFSGRRHFYEGGTFNEITAAIDLVRKLGIGKLILTNAAGALNPAADAGDVVLLDDFIIPFDAGIDAETDYSMAAGDSADAGIRDEIRRAARIEEIVLKTGTYAFMPGPAFETPAEVRMLRMFGADVVGMSTAHEWWAALRAGIAVGGLSLVTNVHRPGGPQPAHDDVLAAAKSAGEKLNRILHRVVFGVGA